MERLSSASILARGQASEVADQLRAQVRAVDARDSGRAIGSGIVIALGGVTIVFGLAATQLPVAIVPAIICGVLTVIALGMMARTNLQHLERRLQTMLGVLKRLESIEPEAEIEVSIDTRWFPGYGDDFRVGSPLAWWEPPRGTFAMPWCALAIRPKDGAELKIRIIIETEETSVQVRHATVHSYSTRERIELTTGDLNLSPEANARLAGAPPVLFAPLQLAEFRLVDDCCHASAVCSPVSRLEQHGIFARPEIEVGLITAEQIVHVCAQVMQRIHDAKSGAAVPQPK